MSKFIQMMWFSAGLVLLGVAYIGVITPGIPWSTPSIGAAYCFAKSNKKWHAWLMNHKIFGKFLHNWQQHRVFPTPAKWAMFVSMDVSLLIVWFTTHNIWLTVGLAVVLMAIAAWAWRYPGSLEIAQARASQAKSSKV